MSVLSYTEHRWKAMGSNAHVIIAAADQRGEELMGWAVDEVERLEALWSRFRPSSDLSRINQSSGRPVLVDPITVSAVEVAIEASRLTNGVFDPTVLTALEAAGYRTTFPPVAPATPPVAPATTSLEAGPSPAPGPGTICVHPVASTVSIPAGVAIDLGGIGKGLTADAVADGLGNRGADRCLVNLGGDVRLLGAPGPAALAEPWTVELECPGSARAPREVNPLRVVSGAVCTSSTQRRRWRGTTGELHHLIDPQTGRPSTSDLRSATVVAATAAGADVLAKVSVIVGLEQAVELIAATGATGVLVDEAGRVIELAGVEEFR